MVKYNKYRKKNHHEISNGQVQQVQEINNDHEIINDQVQKVQEINIDLEIIIMVKYIK